MRGMYFLWLLAENSSRTETRLVESYGRGAHVGDPTAKIISLASAEGTGLGVHQFRSRPSLISMVSLVLAYSSPRS